MSTTNAADIIKQLKDEANEVLSAAVGSTPLESFDITTQGNFPYVWQNPSNIKFNTKTYDWIDGNLKSGSSPLQFDSGTNFTNLYLQVAGKIRYSLSTTDQASLNEFANAATKQQAAVLNAWKAAGNPIPSGNTPMDEIVTTITQKWANPAVSLQDIQSSINPSKLLNNVPASGGGIVKVFFSWVSAMGKGVALQDNITENNAYLDRAISAIKSPSEQNGGLILDSGKTLPAYSVANQVSDIENQLSSGPELSLSMTVTKASSDQFKVSVKGSAGVDIPVLDFLTVGIDGNASFFSDKLVTSNTSTTVKMTFPGANLVNFGPVNFTQAGDSSSWYWIDPIKEAEANGYPAKDVSGFKYEVQPSITDLSVGSSFGFLQGAAISGYPTIEISTSTSDFKSIEKTFQQTVSSSVSFLGIKLASATESTYSNSVTVDSSSQTVTITLSPPKSLVAGNVVDSVGWILGVQPMYPAA